jgi:hypothetical protein
MPRKPIPSDLPQYQLILRLHFNASRAWPSSFVIKRHASWSRRLSSWTFRFQFRTSRLFLWISFISIAGDGAHAFVDIVLGTRLERDKTFGSGKIVNMRTRFIPLQTRCRPFCHSSVDYRCADKKNSWRVGRRHWRHLIGLDSLFAKNPMFTQKKKKNR